MFLKTLSLVCACAGFAASVQAASVDVVWEIYADTPNTFELVEIINIDPNDPSSGDVAITDLSSVVFRLRGEVQQGWLQGAEQSFGIASTNASYDVTVRSTGQTFTNTLPSSTFAFFEDPFGTSASLLTGSSSFEDVFFLGIGDVLAFDFDLSPDGVTLPRQQVVGGVQTLSLIPTDLSFQGGFPFGLFLDPDAVTPDISQFLSITEVGVAPVPLPASMWMLLSGLGGVALIRRRRRSASA